MDALELKLRDAMRAPGCPVCRLVERFEKEEIEIILYEHSTDPEVRKAFRRSGGLCTRHAWKLIKVAFSNPLLGPHGVSLIYEDVLERYLRGEETTGECFLCRLSNEKEQNLIESFAYRLSALIDVYEASPSILCRKHYESILALIKDNDLKRRLSIIQRNKLEELRTRLIRFINSFNYLSNTKPNEEEKRALLEAVEFLVGREVGSEQSFPRRGVKRWPLRLK